MNQDKKLALIEDVNDLLGKMNKTVDTDGEVKALIQTAYNTINKPEKTTQKYNQISDAIREMNGTFQELAVAKKYHFSAEQNEIINKLRTLSREPMSQKGIGTINGAVW
ncbi:hypothetical protein [Companilactobacillus sp. HBUAS56275]|uniref:Bacteriocin immunity protein n=1 Tax=Candidatus Companilactobacillus pullicola TaxID=2838523 RepID=A0A9D2CPB6_9LACO|nr:bacteriocin immunity protein [Candidatus Companilactobacillus pullicola]